MDISKISFFVNINLNKSYCKDCIIYMAHIVLDLSLPSFFFSFSPIPNPCFAHIVRPRRHTCAPIRNPIRSTSSFADRRPESASRFAKGSVVITRFFRMTILRVVHVSRPTYTKMHLHLGRHLQYPAVEITSKRFNIYFHFVVAI